MSDKITKNPNVVFIVMDTARLKNFSCYGYPKKITPNIDLIASEGAIYENTISAAPWTLPSHASFFTGLNSSEHNTNAKNGYLNPCFPTLAQKLSKMGYDTAAFTNNPFISPIYGLSRGFKDYFPMFAPDKRIFKTNVLNIQSYYYESNKRGINKISDLFKQIIITGNPLKNLINLFSILFHNSKIRQFFGDDGAKLTNKTVLDWINKKEWDSPFFIFINYMECHAPYSPPYKYRKRKLTFWKDLRINQDAWGYYFKQFSLTKEDFNALEELYMGEMSYLDAKIGELINSLREIKILDNTILIITSDHGENIGDHGLLSHNLSVHDTLVHVPLIIRYPKLFDSGTRIKRRIQTHFLYQFLIDLANGNLSNSPISPFYEGNEDYPVISEMLGFNLKLMGVDQGMPLAELQKKYPGVDFKKCNFELQAIYSDLYKFVKHSDPNHNSIYNLEINEDTNLIQKYSIEANNLDFILTHELNLMETRRKLKEKMYNLKKKRNSSKIP